MLPNAESLAAEYAMLPPGSHVLCALSGGADSMCLLHWLTTRPALSVSAAHFDHRLRGAESDGDAAFVRAQCAGLGVPLQVDGADVAAAAQRAGAGIEETARSLRYAFLEKTAANLGCDVIATAHNADDNAETLLLHLVRGSGLRGLTGIPPRRGRLVRPLLTTSRAEILAYLERHHLPHREDSSNTDETYARNKLRARVMPVLKELNPSFPHTAAAAIRSLRTDSDCLERQAALACSRARQTEEGLAIPADAIACLPPALAPRAARRLLELAGGSADCSAAHLNGITALARSADPSAALDLPHGLQARRVYDTLLLTARAPDPLPLRETPLDFDGVTTPENSLWRCTCRPCLCPDEREPGVWYLRREALGPEAVLRPRRPGDSLAVSGRRGTKPVKKWLIDAKLPRRERDRLPLLCDSAGVAALAGFGPAAERTAQPGQAAWAIRFEPVSTH